MICVSYSLRFLEAAGSRGSLIFAEAALLLELAVAAVEVEVEMGPTAAFCPA
jgi:hypothetical protein